MKKHILFIASLVSFFSFSQTYYLEDFDGIPGPTAGGAGTYNFAPGFLLRNVDNRTPAPQVAYVNEAWERREDFGGSVVDSAAFSTSYYSPVGAADDFMWTPMQTIQPNTTLFWNAKAYDALYPDGYEVRIMTAPNVPSGGTGVLGNQVSASTVIFSTVAENSTWTNRSVSLSAYSGQNVYIGFRNNSNDKFILVIDDIELRVINNHDLQTVTPTQNPYTIAPANQLTTPQNFKLEAAIKNNGIQAMTNVMLGCQVIKDGVLETTVMSNSIASLASGATSALMTVSYTPSSNGVYTFKYFPIATETDENTANDTIQSSLPLTVTDAEMARDNGIVVGQLGIGSGTTGYLGQVFTIENTTSLTDVKVYFTRGYTGKRLATAIYSTNGSGVPTTLITSTDTLLYLDDSARFYTLPIHGGPLTLTPGKYGFMQIEFDSTLALANTAAIFQNNTVFVQWAANGPNFVPVETFGANFAKSFVIRPQFDICFGEIGGVLSNSANSTCELANGSATLTLEPGYTVIWEDSSSNPAITNLTAGYHVYTISNGDCDFTDSVEITTTSVPDLSILATNPLCFGDSGEIQIDIQNGQAPYDVTWNVAGDSTVLSVPAGAYTATVTDANGCTATISETLTEPSPIAIAPTTTISSCSNCPDGTASASATGGTGSYTYLWSNGGTTSSISNLLPGVYNVTVTDANGCEETASVTVGFSTLGIDELTQFGVTVYPNPVTDFIKIESTKSVIERVELMDNSGRLVAESTINNKTGQIETSQLAKGNYQLVVRTADQLFKVQIIK